MKKKTFQLLIIYLIFFYFSANIQALDDNKYLISEEPLELTIHMYIETKYPFKDEWPVFKKAAELTNIKLKGTAPTSATNSVEVFNLMMASGNLADIVQFYTKDINKFGMRGAFIPLNKLIDEYAPNIKAFLEKRPEIKRLITAVDGNIYCIPHVRDGEVALGWFIRNDWLKKLGLKQPRTVEEYYQVLKAFRQQDPNENGLKDEIPFFARHTDYAINGLMILWKAQPGWYQEGGRVYFGPYTPEYRIAVKNIAQWYREGLIDPQLYTRGPSSREELLSENKGGSTHDWFGSTSLFNDKLEMKIEGFEFLPIAPPAGVDGIRRENSRRSIGGEEGWAISYSNPYPVETIKYFDFFWTEKGRRLMNFGIEGDTYVIVNGQLVFKNWIKNSEKNILDILFEDYGSQQRIGFHQDFHYEEQWMNPIALAGVKMYMNNGYMIDQFPKLNFNEEEYRVIYDIMPDIETYVEEMRQKWILGAHSIEDTYSQYRIKLQEMGIEQIIAIYQKAYNRYLNSYGL